MQVGDLVRYRGRLMVIVEEREGVFTLSGPGYRWRVVTKDMTELLCATCHQPLIEVGYTRVLVSKEDYYHGFYPGPPPEGSYWIAICEKCYQTQERSMDA